MLETVKSAPGEYQYTQDTIKIGKDARFIRE